MSDQEQPQRPQVSDTECAMCGRDGGPVVGCELCNGNQRYSQSRSFTLSEERQGLNPHKDGDRYGQHGDVSPKIVVVPGGYDPRQGKQKQ
jgi:hypothetical protein